MTPPGTSLLGNITFNLAGRVLVVVLALITTPILVHRLNTAGYGIYILSVTLGGLVGLLDFGLGPALVVSLARSAHLQDHDRSQALVSTAMSLYFGIGTLGGAGFALVVPWVVGSLLNVPPPLAGAARESLFLSAMGFGLTTCLSVFNAVPTALERYDLLTKRLVAVSCATAMATVAYALVGGILQGFVLISVAGGIGVVVSFYVVSRSLMPDVNFHPGFDRSCFRELARFSAFKFIGSLGGTLAFRFDQIAIGSLLGVSAIGFYAIPANGVLRVHGFLSQLVAPLFPRVSKLRADRESLRTLYLRSSGGVAAIAVMVWVPIFFFADPLLRFWIGGSQGVAVARTSGDAMRWLVAAFLIQSLAAVPVTFCEGLGKPQINNGFSALSALIHVPLVLILVPRYGISGAAIALVLNSLSQTVLFIGIVGNRLAHVPLRQLAANLLLPAFAAGGIAGLLGYSLHGVAERSPSLLLVCLAALPIAYLAAASRFGGLELMRTVVSSAAGRLVQVAHSRTVGPARGPS